MNQMLMAKEWEQFAKILPAHWSEDQRREIRRAFYAGAQAILFRVIAAFAPETEPTVEDIQVMENLHQELQEFGRAIKEGRA